MGMHTLTVRLLFVALLWCFAVVAQAQQVPADLAGDWGTPQQCQAQAQAGLDETVSHVRDAPYRFSNVWISRWFFYCRVLNIDPLGPSWGPNSYRVLGLCGEDAVERPWEIDIVRDEDTLSMTWYAVAEHEGASRPWAIGPLQRCERPAS